MFIEFFVFIVFVELPTVNGNSTNTSIFISDNVAFHKFVKRIYFLSTFLSILPTAVRGISSMNSMILGTS